MQFHSPSVVQAVPAAMAEPVPVVPELLPLPVLAGAAEDATGVEATTLEATDATGVEEANGAEVAWDDGTVAKTPPEIGAAEEVATAAEVVALEAAAEVAEDPDPAVAVALPETAFPHPAPVGATGVAVEMPSCSSESPGLGNFKSWESTEVHWLPMFAVNISGRALYAAVSRSISWVMLRAMSSSSSLRLDEDAVRVIGAQFMYISRLPILLNQVQASVAVPVGRVVGIVKE